MRVKRVLDLTRTMTHNQPNLPIFPAPRIELIAIGPKDGWNMERLTITTHQGTHMDAPWHLNGCGSKTIDEIPAGEFQGEAVVVDLRHKGPRGPIIAADLEPYRFQQGQIALLVTGWDDRVAWSDEWLYQSPFLAPDGARYLVDRGVRGVAMDHFSIGGTGDDNEKTHRTLLENQVWIAEYLAIPGALFERQTWHMFALPLKLERASGAQARIIAVEYE